MKAIIVPHNGGPEVLEYSELETPTPGAGQVLVEVAAAGINFIDTYQRKGTYPVPTPFILGAEGAGRVSELGPDVTELAVGDRIVWKTAPGSYSSHVLVPVSEGVRIPDGVSEDVAAAVILQGLTAHFLSHDSYRIEAGDTVVVHAAAGGVGLLLTQIAKRLGATVIGTVSTPEKATAARAAGADEVVGYEDFVEVARKLTDGKGAHAVYDGVGKSTFDASLTALRVRGTLVLFGASSGPVPPFDPQRLNAGGSLYLTRPTLAHFTQDRAELMSRADDVLGWVQKGELNVAIGGRYPLSEARRAHEDLEARRTSGKLLLIP